LKSIFFVSGAFVLSEVVVTQSIFLGSVNCKGWVTGVANSVSSEENGTGSLLLQAAAKMKRHAAKKILYLMVENFLPLKIKILFQRKRNYKLSAITFFGLYF
jgi:hypothetical protein